MMIRSLSAFVGFGCTKHYLNVRSRVNYFGSHVQHHATLNSNGGGGYSHILAICRYVPSDRVKFLVFEVLFLNRVSLLTLWFFDSIPTSQALSKT